MCVSSLRRGHANLLCIVPILTDDPRRESSDVVAFKSCRRFTAVSSLAGVSALHVAWVRVALGYFSCNLEEVARGPVA